MSRAIILTCIVICGLLFIGASLRAPAQSSIEPIKTTVCEISGNPTRFARKMVVFSSQFESDGIERSVLTDRNCIDVGIAVSTPKHYIGEAALSKALSVGRPGTPDKVIKGTFVGRFKWQPQGNPKRILILSEVRSLSSTPK